MRFQFLQMKSTLVPGVLAGTLCAVHPASAQTVLNFDSLASMSNGPSSVTAVPTADQLSTGYQNSFGVSFTSSSAYVAVVNLGNLTQSPPNAIAGVTAGGLLDYTAANPIFANFFVAGSNGTIRGGVSSVSVEGDLDSTSGGANISMTAYDFFGNAIMTDTESDQGGTVLSVSSATSQIDSVKITGNGTVGFDNFTFSKVTGAASAPEPGTFVLLLPALSALGLALRLRWRAQEGMVPGNPGISRRQDA